jgi:hypothetical protein
LAKNDIGLDDETKEKIVKLFLDASCTTGVYITPGAFVRIISGFP